MNQFYIMSLADVRAHLRIPTANTDDDDMLSNIFIPAANDVLRTECGDTIPQQYDELHDGGKFVISLRNIPIIDVSLVQEGWGFTNYDLDYVEVNSDSSTSMFAYSIDNGTMGSISRRSAGNVNIRFIPGTSNIRVVYTAGRQSVPGTVKLAGLELVRIWYQESQQRQLQYQPDSADSLDMDQPTSGALGGLIGMNLGVPSGIIEMLKPYRHMPYIG